MSARRPDPSLELTGRCIRLVPITPGDLPELFAALGTAHTFAGGYGGGPIVGADPRLEIEGFVEFMTGYLRFGTASVFGVRLRGGPDDGALVGTSTLGDIELARESAHIGWTAYDHRVWGTIVNPEAKLLMLGAAFAHGFGRIKLQADARNTRSRAAIERLGAAFEGIARRDAPRMDGTWRDAAVYSITIDDWPHVRTGLQERVEVWSDAVIELAPRPSSR
jgi:RimJ/RimL family protein N-acetyltransferase